MLKLFFVIATLTTLVKSEDAFEWVCPDINQMGNCSSLPDIPQLIKMMDEDSKTNKYSDIYYCPYNIVKRYAKCIHSYYLSCYEHMTNEDKTFFSMNLPTIDESSFCITDRAYKKEFREHMACTKVLATSDDQLNHEPYKQWQQYLEQHMLEFEEKKQEKLKSDKIEDILSLRFMSTRIKCQYFRDDLQLRFMQMRTLCGSKTEKFFRQLLGNIWPLPMMLKYCNSDSFKFN